MGSDDKEFPALAAYVAEAGVSSSKSAEPGIGGTGALDQSKTEGTGRMVEAARSGGRHGLIGGGRKGLVDKGLIDGHGHGHEQEHEHVHSRLSSVAAPRGSSPMMHSHENAVLTTTPTTTNKQRHNDETYCS